jgi:hypothetical protein
MKFVHALTIFTTAAAMANAETSQRGLATLAEKWNITEPTFAYDSNRFNLTFPVTDFINTGMAKYTLWTAPDCQEGGVSLGDNELWDSHTLVENDALAAADQFSGAGNTMLDSGAFIGGRQAIVTAGFDPQTISQSDIYSEQTIDNQVVAEIRFCIRFGLFTTEDLGVNTPVEVNFLETIITLTVDLTDGFEIGAINVEPRDRLVRTANQAYEVRGFECDPVSKEQFNEVEKNRPRNQGEIINVCVTPEDEAKDDGIFMRSVDDFVFTRGTDIRQIAVENNRAAGNLLTSYDHVVCEGTEVCVFSTILFAAFYATPGVVSGEGVASMQFGEIKTGETRRQLRANENAQQRQLQEEGAGAAEFDLNFQVAQAVARDGTSGAASFGVAASFGAIAAVAALL